MTPNNFKNLTGMRFGRLIILNRENDLVLPCGQKKTMWLCSCDCGNKVIVASRHLLSKKTFSCGCFRNENTSKIFAKDLGGQRFGRLVAIRNTKRKNNSFYLWECICDCGNIIEVISGNLLKGHTKSCGCLKKEQAANFIDIKGMVFKKLTVLYDTGMVKDENHVWKCKCECGKETDVLGSSLRSGHTQSCGCQSESFIASELKKYYVKNYNAKTEYRILKNSNTGYHLPYDIYIPQGKDPKNNGVYIEVNGKHHYQINGLHEMKAKQNGTTADIELQKQKTLDKTKRNFAKDNGFFICIDLRKIKTTKQAIIYIENILELKGKQNGKNM